MAVNNQGPGGNSTNMVPIKPKVKPSNGGVPGSNTRIVIGGAGNSGAKRFDNGMIIAPGNSQVVRDFNDFNARAPKYEGDSASSERGMWAADGQVFALSGKYPTYPTDTTDTNPTGSGYAPAGIDQGSYDTIIEMLGGTKPKAWTPEDYAPPQAWEYQDLVLADQGPFDTSQYDMADQGITQGIGDARTRGTTAFDRSSAEIAGYQNPYARGLQQRTPGTDPALQRSMAAWGGAGSEAAAQEAQFGFTSDQGLDSMYDLLGRSEDSYSQGLQRGIAGDRMELDQRLGGEERMMRLDLNTRKAKALSDFAATQRARQDQMDLANNAGRNRASESNNQAMNDWMAANTGVRNDAGQANNQSQNDWMANLSPQVIDMILRGMDGSGRQTLTDLTGGGRQPW